MKLRSTLIALTLLTAAAPPALAQAAATPSEPVLRLNAEAVRRVSLDEMTVVLASERAGEAPGALNAQVLAELDGALAQARQTPGVIARLGNLRTQPAPRGRSTATAARAARPHWCRCSKSATAPRPSAGSRPRLRTHGPDRGRAPTRQACSGRLGAARPARERHQA